MVGGGVSLKLTNNDLAIINHLILIMFIDTAWMVSGGKQTQI